MSYKYYQPNKKDVKDKNGDCVVRALTKVSGLSWHEVFDELVPVARLNWCMPNERVCYEHFLKNHGFTYVGISNSKGSKRPTVSLFSKKYKTGTYVLRVAHHLVAVVDGDYFDTWDSGEKSLYGYWVEDSLE